MKERPILFSAPMVRAILEGRKTQTRRALKAQPSFDCRGITAAQWAERDGLWMFPHVAPEVRIRCPYGQPGDRLWVRETWCGRKGVLFHGCAGTYFYRADGEHQPGKQVGFTYMEREGRWRPSIHMPRWASRIDLEVTCVRVERLQGISEDDARSEGVAPHEYPYCAEHGRYRMSFARLWDSINRQRATWAGNPFVWVIEFKRVEQSS